ncbi:tetratricopeptide repeat protein [Bifidobacterium dolichotidis]|nr:tetratricopeptide repeat protein [Bifidobacterium dolichotidis]
MNRNETTPQARQAAQQSSSSAASKKSSAAMPSMQALLEMYGKNHIVKLSPFIKKRMFRTFPGVPDNLTLGWAQLPKQRGSAFTLGIFIDDRRMIPLARADARGRVFLGYDPYMDTHDVEPAFAFVKDHDGHMPDSDRFNSHLPKKHQLKHFGKQHNNDQQIDLQQVEQLGLHVPEQNADSNDSKHNQHKKKSAKQPVSRAVVVGNMVGRDNDGRMIWLASWLKSSNRYSLEQVRTPLPQSMRTNLEYRDAIAIAFFATYMVPQTLGLLIGFGSGNIFRRLGREAPLGAARRSVEDTMNAKAKGLRVSGLERFFADLMEEADVLEPVNGLEAEHGAEPLSLVSSPLSDTYALYWSKGLSFDAALSALQFEGAINRFSLVSSWLEHNDVMGSQPIEDTVTREQAAMIDQALIRNPALLALGAPSRLGRLSAMQHAYVDLLREDGFLAINDLIKLANRVTCEYAQADSGKAAKVKAAQKAQQKSELKNAELKRTELKHTDLQNAESVNAGSANADNATQQTSASKLDMKKLGAAAGSEWVYRRALATMQRKLRLPFRFDTEFRVNLKEGRVGVAVTQAGPALMPKSEYDAKRDAWRTLDDTERAEHSVDYNLRVALILAALAFGADETIEEVDLRIDSIGLEEAISEQNTAIEAMVSDALNTFERMQQTPDSKTPSKHVTPSAPESKTHITTSSEDQMSKTDDLLNQSDVDSEFERLMQGADIDEVMFNEQFAAQNNDKSSEPMNAIESQIEQLMGSSNSDDPMSGLQRPPAMQPLVSVTFTRERFLKRMAEVGLADPRTTMRMFDAKLETKPGVGFVPTVPPFSLQDERFGPDSAQQPPEEHNKQLDAATADVLGTADTFGLAINREDLLAFAMQTFQQMSQDETLDAATRAQRASELINRINDPELYTMASSIASALIDGQDLQGMSMHWTNELNEARNATRDMLFSGRFEEAIEQQEQIIADFDRRFHGPVPSTADLQHDAESEHPLNTLPNNEYVPRYFNSYAERVVYNKLYATAGERLVLVPDALVYMHLEQAELLSQLGRTDAAMRHLNQVVAYAPAFAQGHLRLAMQMRRMEDWGSVKAVALNALRVSLDRDAASAAYHQLAYAAWMRDEFELAIGCYVLSTALQPANPLRAEEMRELVERMQAQCMPMPTSIVDVARVLTKAGVPMWPGDEIANIVGPAARATVDHGMFVPGRTLAVAHARIAEARGQLLPTTEPIQMQFIRSLTV